MQKYARAQWKGGLKDGTGIITTESGVLNSENYGFNKRFEGEPGTNPEELIGAAHASCFSMALSNELGQMDIIADQIDTKSVITLEKKDDGFAITKSHLTVTVAANGDHNDIQKAAENAKSGCPVSKLLNAEITMDLTVK